jgi:hypothetical protein
METRSSFHRRVMAASYGTFLASAAASAAISIAIIWVEPVPSSLSKVLGTAMALTMFSFVVMIGTRALEARG